MTDEDVNVMANTLSNNRILEVYFTNNVPHNLNNELPNPNEPMRDT